MATIKFDGIKEYSNQIMELGKRGQGILKYASYDAAAIVCDAIKATAPVTDGKGYPVGGMRDSIGLQHFKDKHGYVYTCVVFRGYDQRGVPYHIMAAVLTSGRSDQPGRKKNPWIRKAVKSVEAQAIASMQKNIDKKMQEIMKG